MEKGNKVAYRVRWPPSRKLKVMPSYDMWPCESNYAVANISRTRAQKSLKLIETLSLPLLFRSNLHNSLASRSSLFLGRNQAIEVFGDMEHFNYPHDGIILYSGGSFRRVLNLAKQLNLPYEIGEVVLSKFAKSN